MKKKLIDLFWKVKAWYITMFATVLFIINLFLKDNRLIHEVWIIQGIGVIKLTLDESHRASENFKKYVAEARCRFMLELLPYNLKDAIGNLEMDENLRTTLYAIIDSEYWYIQEHEKEIRSDDVH